MDLLSNPGHRQQAADHRGKVLQRENSIILTLERHQYQINKIVIDQGSMSLMHQSRSIQSNSTTSGFIIYIIRKIPHF